jgi:hypothetical protein
MRTKARIAVVPGDGIGTEVIEQGCRVIRLLMPEVELEHFGLGADHYLKTGETLPDAINRLFGARIKIVSGYSGGAEVNLAIERGEIQGRCSVSVSSINSTRPDWFASKKVSVPIQIALRRSAHFPDVPALIEFAPDKRTHDILEVLLAYQDMDRPMLAPPGLPPERLELLRTAFHAGITDPAFLAEAQRLGLEIEEVSGKRLEDIVTNAYGLPQDVLQAARDAMTMGGQTK